MDVHYSNRDALSKDAERLVEFDMGSIRQMVAADGAADPDFWLVDPSGYQDGGHPRRDSESIRLIGYSSEPQTVYATDGCNSCRHLLDARLENLSEEALELLSQRTQLPRHMLERLAELTREATH
jgi:hypothetical protein